MAHLVVVGAGAAGLLAALQARARGDCVTVLEAGSRAGGVMATTHLDGWLVEQGPNTMAPLRPEIRDLLAPCGYAELVRRPEAIAQRRYLVHQGALLPLPTRVGELVSSPLLSVAGRLRLLKEPFVERGGHEEESVDAFVRRRLGAEAADRIVDPYLAGTSGGDPKVLLARHVLPRLVRYEHLGGSILRGALRSRRMVRRRTAPSSAPALPGIWSCEGGLVTLIDRIAATLAADLRTGVRVVEVRATDGGFAVACADGETLLADAVVVAVPAPALAAIRWEVPEGEQLAGTAQIPYASMAVVALGYRREVVGHPLDGFGLLAASVEQRRILGALFTSALFPDRAPTGHALITAFVGGGRRPELLTLDDADLFALVEEELRDLLSIDGAPVFRHLTRWEAAMPQAVVGHGDRLAAAAAVEAATPGLAFAGAWRDGLAVGEVMWSGVQAVERACPRSPEESEEEVS